MADQNGQPPGGSEPTDPWAPPEHRPSQDISRQGQPQQPPPSAHSVHDQPTVAGMPGSTPPLGAVPPPPAAPGGPTPQPGPYGYPGPAAQQPGAGAPGGPYGAGPGYGYPSYPAAPSAGAPVYGNAAPYAGPGGVPPYPGAAGGWGAPGWQQGPSNGMGTAALVLGILSVVGFCLYGVFGFVVGILAIVFGAKGRGKAKRGESTNGGSALAGIILGSVGVVIGAVFIAILVWAFSQRDDFDAPSPDDPFAASLVLHDAR